jgi:flagellar basal body-associated protein FliL
MKIVNLILRILLFVILGITVVTNALSSYVLLAPDSFPKPFYVMYVGAPTSLPVDPPQPTSEAAPTPGELPNATPAAGETPTAEPCLLPFLCPSTASNETPAAVGTPIPPAFDPKSLQPGQGIMVDTGAKVVNLADPGGRRFVRVSIVLEFAPNNPAYYTSIGDAKNTIVTTFTTELSPKLPVVNDILVTVLSSKTFEQIYSPDGKDALRKEIIQQLNARLPEYSVIYVYFTEFAVQ